MVTGDRGDSLIFKKPIAELLAQKITASAIIVIISLAVQLGNWATVHRGKWRDTVSSTTSLVGVGLPDFFWGIVMILVFAR